MPQFDEEPKPATTGPIRFTPTESGTETRGTGRRQSVAQGLREELGREPTEQEVNLYVDQMDHLGF